MPGNNRLRFCKIGPLPTSKVLRAWLAKLDATSFLLHDRPVNTDPLHRVATPLCGKVDDLAKALEQQAVDVEWVAYWTKKEQELTVALDKQFEQTDALFEGKIAWLLSGCLPKRASVFIANSMSVRYAEYFWRATNREFSVYCNRGANGIDGTLGTAMGIAHRGNPAVLLTGDLLFYTIRMLCLRLES